MGELIPYKEQFEQVVDIIESAKERAYRKVNEELILMYRDIGEYISILFFESKIHLFKYKGNR